MHKLASHSDTLNLVQQFRTGRRQPEWNCAPPYAFKPPSLAYQVFVIDKHASLIPRGEHYHGNSCINNSLEFLSEYFFRF